MAYCRSKLGVNWLTFELHERYPELWVNLVHPGVVDTDLVAGMNLIKKLLFVKWEVGA
jgi:NAD(P)-dependent dehydrogenase (short-subunit alcohol dehydrogenase family)